METPRLSRNDKVLLTSLPLTVDQPMQHSPNSAKLLRVAELNPHLTCPLCGGYYIDATSITECLHSFCRSCIVSHLSKSLHCPVCSEKVHETKPLLMIREDKTLQDLVYKLVPGLLVKEIKRRRDFYNERNPDDARKDCLLSGASARNSEAARLSVQIKERGEGADWQRYLYCPASMSVGHLMAWLRGKLKICRRRFEIRVVHRSRDCRPQQTLADLRDMVPTKDDGEKRLLLEFERRKAVGPNKNGPCYHCGATVSQEFGVYVNTGTIVAKGTIRRPSENVEKSGEEEISAPIAKKMKTIDEKVKDSDSGIDAGSGSPSENNSGEKENKGVTGSENIQTPAARPNGQILKSPPNSAKKPSVLLAQLTKPALRPPPQTLFPSTPSAVNKNIPRPSTPKRTQNKTPRAPTPKRVKKEEPKAQSNLSKLEEKTNQTKTPAEQRKSPVAVSTAPSKPMRGINEVVERLHSKNSKCTTNGSSPGNNNGLNGTPSTALPPSDKDRPSTGGAVMVVNDPPTVTTLKHQKCCRSDETGRCKGHPVNSDSKPSNPAQYGSNFPLDLSKTRFPIPLNVPVPRPSIMPH